MWLKPQVKSRENKPGFLVKGWNVSGPSVTEPPWVHSLVSHRGRGCTRCHTKESWSAANKEIRGVTSKAVTPWWRGVGSFDSGLGWRPRRGSFVIPRKVAPGCAGVLRARPVCVSCEVLAEACAPPRVEIEHHPEAEVPGGHAGVHLSRWSWWRM